MNNAELDDRLAELFTGYNVLPASMLDRARKFQESRGGTLAGSLTELHIVEEDMLPPLLEELTGVRAVDPSPADGLSGFRRADERAACRRTSSRR